ncbi:hypothetical protein PHLCEN_2v5427 [Hermanssonia centrifuga]|uniref:F-box domain-containing protein n=1 Tax=Hermanssonia centrifuga TaxID=98765 RepID=A0A2R6P304_9APHY|nr:hypothetical protein PHLCEN_2v5427 [Hermanssonia centrifuga]
MSDAAARIPQELFDNIIDLVHPGKWTLSSFSLVSRSWLAKSRRRLFARVHLVGVQHQFLPFLTFITVKNNSSLLGPPLSRFVESVHVENREVLLTDLAIINTDMLRSLLSLLPNLRDLRFSGITLSWVAPIEPEDWLAFRPVHLDNLSLLGTTTVSLTPLDIIASLRLFSSIKVLHISMLGFDEYEFPQNPTALSTHPLLSWEDLYFPSKLRVSSIKSSDICLAPFLLALMAKTASVGTITDVDIACRTMNQIRALGSFLHVVGRRIRNITVDVIELCWITSLRLVLRDRYLQSFNLTACTNLTSLTLRMSLSPYRNDLNIVAFNLATNFLSRTSATVHTIILEILLDSLDDFYEDLTSDTLLCWIRRSAGSEFTDFQSVIRQRRGVCKLCIRWGKLQDQAMLETKLIEWMNLFAWAQLSELDANGILCFESI